VAEKVLVWTVVVLYKHKSDLRDEYGPIHTVMIDNIASREEAEKVLADLQGIVTSGSNRAAGSRIIPVQKLM
jgi:hypothetical protein